MFTKQYDNVAGGDIVAGSKAVSIINVNQKMIDELNLLYQKLKQNPQGEASDGTFCEQLEHYMSAKTKGDVRGLEQKLAESDRLDLLDYAVEMKERAAKAIMLRQTSRTAQRIFTIVLDELHTNFMLTVTPHVQAGADRTQVDLRVQAVLQCVRDTLGENLLEFTVKDLLGLLYFLGGNCHIRWDKC